MVHWNRIILVFCYFGKAMSHADITPYPSSDIFCLSLVLAYTPKRRSLHQWLSGRSEWQRQGRTLRLWEPKGHSCIFERACSVILVGRRYAPLCK